MSDIIQNSKIDFDKAVDNLNHELSTLRVGRANPVIVDGIMVEVYGVRTPLKQMASITVPEARTLLIQPWDKSTSKDIEKAIIQANIGINPVNEGAVVRLTVPQLTEETRKSLVKNVGEKMEKTRITIRQIRDRVKDEINKSEKNKEIAEDEKFALQKKLDDMVKDYNEKVKQIGEKKEEEIMTI
jgi:ribosome recycling factor